MDIHGYIHGYIHRYIHVWISDLGHPVDTSMDIVLAHFSIKLNTYSTNIRENEDYEHQREKHSSIQAFSQINLLALYQ